MALKNVFLFFALTCLIPYATAARNTIKPAAADANAETSFECIIAYSTFVSCQGEFERFISEKKGDIRPICCRAIDIAASKCPSIDRALFGFTREQWNKIVDNCKTSSAPVPAPST